MRHIIRQLRVYRPTTLGWVLVSGLREYTALRRARSTTREEILASA